MLECDDCGATRNSKGKPFRSEQGVVGHKQFAHERAGSDAERADGRSAATRRQVPMGEYEDLEEDRNALREEVEGLRASARQLKTTLAQSIENEAGVRGRVGRVEAERDSLRDELERLKAEAEARLAQAPAHLPGLCSDIACEPCVAQGQEIATAAYTKGREDLSDRIEAALLAAGGEPLRERVAAVLAQGQEIVEQRQMVIAVVDDKGEPVPGEVVLRAVNEATRKAVLEALKQAQPQMRAFLQQRQQVSTVVP